MAPRIVTTRILATAGGGDNDGTALCGAMENRYKQAKNDHRPHGPNTDDDDSPSRQYVDDDDDLLDGK